MSMLNNDDQDILPQKRRLPEIYKGNNGEKPQIIQQQPKREKLDEEVKRDFRSLVPMLPEKKDNRGRPANSSNSGDLSLIHI